MRGLARVEAIRRKVLSALVSQVLLHGLATVATESPLSELDLVIRIATVSAFCKLGCHCWQILALKITVFGHNLVE